MTIGKLYISPLGILVLLVPVALAIIAILLRAVIKTRNTAGYVSNATKFAYFIMITTIMSVVGILIAGKFDPTLGFFNGDGLWILVVFSFVFFFCYYMIAFKPVTEEQLEIAKEEGTTFFEVAGAATAGVAASSSAVLGWTLKMLALAPIQIVKRTASVIWYKMAGVGGYLVNIGVIALVLVVGGVILAFIAYYYLLFIVVISWFMVVIKFLINLIYLGGPRK